VTSFGKEFRVIPRSRSNRFRCGFVSILLMLLLFMTALPAQEQQPRTYPTIDPQFSPLRAQFNRDSGKVRLLILLDPT
jgi:hypothetical protein